MKYLSRFIHGVGSITAWCALLLVLITCLVVVLRYLFDTPSIPMQEAMTYLHATLFMLGAAYTLQQDAHVRVDIFYRRFSPKRKALVNLLGTLIFLLPLCFFVIVLSWDYVVTSWQLMEGSPEPNGLPFMYVLKTLILVLPSLLLIQALVIVYDNAQVLVKGGQ